MPRVTVLSVNVGRPAVIGRRRGRPVISGIRKQPVPGPSVRVERLDLAGDDQADQVNHGGVDKAVYAYPSEHLPAWTVDLDAPEPYGPGAFGENLTIAGMTEEHACIGDVWQWGTAILQICQPRYPCYKLAMALDRPKVVARMVETGRTGWYLRVLEPGEAPVSGEITILSRPTSRISVLDAHRARLPGAPPDLVRAALEVPELAESLRSQLRGSLSSGSAHRVSS